MPTIQVTPKKNYARQFSWLLLFCCVLLGSGGSLVAQEESTAERRAQLEKLQTSIEDLKQQLEKVKGSRNDLQKQLENNETETSDLLEKIETIREELNTEEQKLGELKQQQKTLISQQREQTADIKQQMLATYRLGGQSNFKLLLNQNNPSKVSRALKYYDYVLESRSEKLNSYIANLEKINAIEPEIQYKASVLTRKQNQLQQRYDDLQKKKSERKTMLVKLDTSIANKDEELAKLEQDQQQLRQLLSTVSTIIGSRPFQSNSEPFSKSQGKLSWPTPGKIKHRFGSNRIGSMKWDGVVIQAVEGTDVRAIHDGRVAFSQYYSSYGLAMLIEHGEGYFTFYAHNQTLHKKQDDWVEAGEVIATVGNSGGQSEPGLFFQVWHNLAKLNPNKWCS